MPLVSFAVLALYGLFASACWAIYLLIRQNGRILMRLEALEGVATRNVPSRGNRPLSDSRIVRDGLPSGIPAPPFRLPRMGGGEVSIEDYRGRNVLLVFSDPHCGPCQKLAPELEQRHRRRLGVDILMVSRGDEAENRKEIAELGLTFPVVLQRQWEVSRVYGMFATPIAFLIDENGVIARSVAVGREAILSVLDETVLAS